MAKRNIHRTALNYFIKHQDELVEKYNGKELLMRGTKVIGAFDSVAEASDEGNRLFGDGNYSLQTCKPGPYAYTICVGMGHFHFLQQQRKKGLVCN